MRDYLLEYLACPVCHRELSWNVARRVADRGGDIIEATAACTSCGASYQVKDGIAAFLTPDLYREDLWEAVDSRLSVFLKENPDMEKALLKSPLSALGRADRFVRGMVLSERGDYQGAREAYAGASEIYTSEYIAAQDSQIAYLVDRVADTSGPVVDLASGKGALVEPLVKSNPSRPLVVTDLSLRVLRSDKARFHYLGIGDSLDYLAFDARRMPFRDTSVPVFTSHVGLQNMRDGEDAVREIRRVLAGILVATSIFYPPGDEETDRVLEQNGLSLTNREGRFSQACATAGLLLSVENRIKARALPTPVSEITGVGLDGLPLKETTIDWCTVVLTRKK